MAKEAIDFMKKLVNYLKQHGYVFQSSEIYGGLANTFDYGPLGAIFKNKIVALWRDYFLTYEENAFEIDSKIILNPQIWKSSGHIDKFSDPLIEDKISKKRYRADKLIEENFPEINAEIMSEEEMHQFLVQNLKTLQNQEVSWGEIRQFNLLFETKQGIVENKKNKLYLRPETAQGIFTNFLNVQKSMRVHLPFLVGQVGKAFRNEVTPGNFIFRTREFEQMELEFFVKPQDAQEAFEKYLQKSRDFLLSLHLNPQNLRFYEQSPDELAHYSSRSVDIQYKFPFGWSELMGVANRTDHDLKVHSEKSLEKLTYLDPFNNKKYLPYVIEPSMGLERLILAIFCEKYLTDENGREYLDFEQNLAPYEVVLLPLSKKQLPELEELKSFFKKHQVRFKSEIGGSIGKRYRRQDAIGVKYCLTIDFDSSQDKTYTLRERNSMAQERLSLSAILKIIKV